MGRIMNEFMFFIDFATGKPAYLHDSTSPSWAPTLHLGYKTSGKEEGDRHMRLKERKEKARNIETAKSLMLLSNIEEPYEVSMKFK